MKIFFLDEFVNLGESNGCNESASQGGKKSIKPASKNNSHTKTNENGRKSEFHSLLRLISEKAVFSPAMGATGVMSPLQS